jgi:hypothetical protein
VCYNKPYNQQQPHGSHAHWQILSLLYVHKRAEFVDAIVYVVAPMLRSCKRHKAVPRRLCQLQRGRFAGYERHHVE